MPTRQFICLNALLLACFVLLATGAAAERPNIVFMMADDLGWGDVAFHGGPCPTPHLDRLVGEGLELTQHYVAPVCSPTRAGLLSGRYWSRFGVVNPQATRAFPWETVTLARALKSAGYDTAITGKWHLGSLPEWGPRKFGFDHSYGSLGGGVGPWKHVYKTGPFSETWHRNDQRITEEGHVTDLIAAEATQWIRSRGEAPFFLYVPFTAVHLPIKEPEDWLARVPQEIKGEVPRQYAACTMHMDDAVGQILQALDETGKRDSTLVVFTSDNGGSWAENNDTKYAGDVYPAGKLPGRNDPWRGQKGQLYEGGIRVPTIVRWPGRVPSGKNTTPLHIVDWCPTFCALGGYEAKADLKWDGRDLRGLLTEGKAIEERSLYFTGPGFRARAVRLGDWKLIEHQGGNKPRVELFNLKQDPAESQDLADQQTARRDELLQLLANIAAADRDAQVRDEN